MPSLDLANETNWQNLWTAEAIAEPGVRPWLHKPIPPQVVGVLVESPLIAAYPTFNPDPNSREERWRFAGWIAQDFQLGISGSPAPTNQGGALALDLAQSNPVGRVGKLANPLWDSINCSSLFQELEM